VGVAVVAMGWSGLLTAGPDTEAWSLTPWLILRGAGFGMSGIPIQNLALSAVSNLAMARASSLFNVTRQIFAAVGVAGLSSYLTNRAEALVPQGRRDATNAVGAPGAWVPATPQHLETIRACLAKVVTADALNDAFVVVVALCFLTMLVAGFLGQDPALRSARAAEAEPEAVKAEAEPGCCPRYVEAGPGVASSSPVPGRPPPL